MKWYVVVKKINGNFYEYYQRTQRVGRQVKTFNRYIGKANGPAIRGDSPKRKAAIIASMPERHQNLRKDYDAGNMSKTEYLEAITTKPPAPVAQPADNELFTRGRDAKIKNTGAFKPVTLGKQERKEDERIRYGSLAGRIRKHKSKLAAAKKATKGVKRINPFIGRATKKKPESPPFGLDKGRYFCSTCGRQKHSVDGEGKCASCAS